MLIKVFENIDAARPEQAQELRKLAIALNATELIIGEKSKAGQMLDGVVYERYAIKCITINSFKDFLNQQLPKAWKFKGKTIAELDSEKLKQIRKLKGLTLSGLAHTLNLAPKTIHGYEKGENSSLEIAKKLEKILSTSLIKGIDLAQKKEQEEIFETHSKDPVFEKISSLGLELALFEHAPFEAFSHPKESLLISKAGQRIDVKRKGLRLKETKKVVRADSVIIAKKFEKKSTENTAVIEEEELESFSKKKDFLETIKEREKKRKSH